MIWEKVFKNGPSKTCGKQPLKNLKGYGLLKQNSLNTLSHFPKHEKALILTNFMPPGSFYTPWKQQKNRRYIKRPVTWNGLMLRVTEMKPPQNSQTTSSFFEVCLFTGWKKVIYTRPLLKGFMTEILWRTFISISSCCDGAQKNYPLITNLARVFLELNGESFNKS